MKRKILVLALLLLLILTLIPTTISMFGTTSAVSTDTEWTLVTDARAMKAYPDLKEYVWQKNASMAPNGPYDKIGLHRLVKTGVMPVGVVFLTDCPNWGEGEQRISNPPTDDWTKYENYSQAIYLANRGFDVYAIDYRSHFIPTSLNSSQVSFMADWGWDVWISDIKEAADKVKEVSGASKFFISGECTGAVAALNYATKYQNDLRGIILLDPQFNVLGYPMVATLGTETNTFNLTQVAIAAKTAGVYTTGGMGLGGATKAVSIYALQNPGAPAQYPPGTPLTPTINPLTNKTWTNITEWYTYTIQYAMAGYPGAYSNLMGGYGNVTQVEYYLSNSEFIPARLAAENMAIADWINCPYVTFDFNDHYKEIYVPVLTFATGLFSNRTGTLRFVNGLNTTDFTTVMLKNYGHTDVYFGTYSARDVSEPSYQWLVNHLPPDLPLFGNKAVGTLYDQNDANAQSVSYFTCIKTGLVTDIKAYISGASAGNCKAAIYAVNGGSASALLAQSKPVSIGTSFSWVDFQLPASIAVTSGTTYGLAVMGDVVVNVMEVSGTGQRDHNAVTSFANGFANPFGPIWGSDDRGAMSIYAASSNTYVTAYGQHGEVILQLPTGNPKVTNVTTIRLIASEFNEKSTFGAYDTLIVALWIPSVNQFVPVAQINNINNSGLDTFLKTLYATTPIWNSQMPNIIDLSNKDFNVWTEEGVIIANLTTTVKVTLPFNLMVGTPYATWGNQTFDLPPLTLMFRPTANSFDWKESITLAKPPFSGYTIDIKSQMAPAWVKADIPTWVKGAWLECSGHICTDLVQTAIPPAT